MESIGLYIHIPFCRQKCLYCDFPSWAGREGQMQMYVDALTAEIRAQGKRYENREVVSVFFGGGTPTALEIPMLAQLMQAIRESFRVTADAELTTEANPGTLSYEMAAALKKMGFNRLSMGVQAWQNSILHRLGRIHTIEEFLENYHAVRQAGFENVNVDLMFALPGQSMAQWQETVRQIAALKPEHISAYSLIIEEGTPFYESYRTGKLDWYRRRWTEKCTTGQWTPLRSGGMDSMKFPISQRWADRAATIAFTGRRRNTLGWAWAHILIWMESAFTTAMICKNIFLRKEILPY